MKAKRITFILPFKSLTGGIKVVLEYANRLTERGHRVTLVYPLIPFRFGSKWYDPKRLFWQFHGIAANLLKRNRIDWFDLDGRVRLLRVPWIHDTFLPDADAVIATAWPTAFSVARLPARKGEKFYFIQGFETFSGPDELVEASYRLPLRQIVIATWLERLMRENYGGHVAAMITNGINLEHFYNENKVYHEPLRLLMLYHRESWKGGADGLDAMNKVRERAPVQIVLFGKRYPKNLEPDIEFHHYPVGERLRKLYCSCDVFLSPSYTEGCQLPPMEAMACQCAVVATNIGGIPDYAIDGETVLTVQPGDIDGMTQQMLRLVQDRELLRRITQAGHRHIRQFTWDRATSLFDEALDA